MNEDACLIFELHHQQYGVTATAVQEIFFIPAIQAIAETSTNLIGVINLRGHLLPVLDLSQRLGQGPHPFALSDSIIVLSQAEQRVAIVVSQVFDVVRLPPTDPALAPLYRGKQRPAGELITLGVTQFEQTVITLLDAAALVRTSQINVVSDVLDTGLAHFKHRFFPEATAAEFATLQERAHNLSSLPAVEHAHNLVPLAVIGLKGEQFALPVENIREFTSIREVTPVPCCPNHIVGNMNLRGEILTLMDIRPVLQLSRETTAVLPKAVVVQVEDIIAGITVDTVSDVMYVQPSNIHAMPVAVHSSREEYLQGMVDFQDTQVSLLNLQKLLLSGDLMVNETA